MADEKQLATGKGTPWQISIFIIQTQPALLLSSCFFRYDTGCMHENMENCLWMLHYVFSSYEANPETVRTDTAGTKCTKFKKIILPFLHLDRFLSTHVYTEIFPILLVTLPVYFIVHLLLLCMHLITSLPFFQLFKNETFRLTSP